MNLMEQRLRELAADGVDLNDIPTLFKEYGSAFGSKANRRDLRKYVDIINGTPLTVPTVEPEEKEVTTVFAPGDESPSQFVPDALMMTGNAIRQAVIKVGGQEAAIELGRVIDSVGGLANFTRAVEFLTTVNALPTQPQIAPPPKSVRDDFISLQNGATISAEEAEKLRLENEASVARIRNNLKNNQC